MRKEKVPVYPLTDYVAPSIAEQGISVSRFEILNQTFDRPPGVHRHEHFELFWLTGPATHFNDFERYKIRAGKPTFVFVNPGQLHRWEGADSIRGTLVSFTTAFVEGRDPGGAMLDYEFIHCSSYDPVLPADKEFIEEAEPIFARCEREFRDQKSDWQGTIRAALRMLLISAQRAHERDDPERRPAKGRTRRLLGGFRARVEEAFRAQTTVAAYARDLGVSPGHLNDVVREKMGKTAGKMIRERVILEAQRLLYYSELSVSEIAYHLGFEDPSHFAKMFRKAAGMSPVEFRKKYQSHHK